MGIAFKDAAIHEGSWVALVAVTNDVFALALGLGDCGPLQTCGIAAAPSATQATLDNRLKDLPGLHFLNGAVKCTITACLDIVLNPFRVDVAAPAQLPRAFVGKRRVAWDRSARRSVVPPIKASTIVDAFSGVTRS